MPISQNLRFEGLAPTDDEVDHPPGVGIAKLLQKQLVHRGWLSGPVDNWRDSGWEFQCTKDGATVAITVAGDGEVAERWLLQIGAAYRPGFVGRLLGKPATAGPSAILTVANEVHAILAADYRGFRWCWDGVPDDTASPQPTPGD